MAIKFTFDRGQLSEREAQILELTLNLNTVSLWATIGAVTGGSFPSRELQENVARVAVGAVEKIMPGLSTRWEWRDDPG